MQNFIVSTTCATIAVVILAFYRQLYSEVHTIRLQRRLKPLTADIEVIAVTRSSLSLRLSAHTQADIVGLAVFAAYVCNGLPQRRGRKGVKYIKVDCGQSIMTLTLKPNAKGTSYTKIDDQLKGILEELRDPTHYIHKRPLTLII